MADGAEAASNLILLCSLLGYCLGRRLLAVGLTGGIACGKSSVGQAVLTTLGAEGCCVIDADDVSRFVQRPGTALPDRLVSEFGGSKVTDESGHLDRQKLAKEVFGEGAGADAVRRLNRLTHAAIGLELLRRFLWEAGVLGKVVVIDAALLLRSAALTWACCPIIVVTCSPQRQRRRLLARDEWMSAEDAAGRIVAQPSGEAMVRLAGWSARPVPNDGSEAQMVDSVRAVAAQIAVEMRVW
jgi:dephospho-CoA kinase